MKLGFAILNLAILPLIWWAPLFGTGLVPFLSLNEISIWSGFVVLLQKDVMLAVLIGVFVMLIPLTKALAFLNHALGREFPSANITYWLARLSMVDVFLVALSVVVVKGIGVGRVEIYWGYWLFTAYVALGFVLSTKALQETDIFVER